MIIMAVTATATLKETPGGSPPGIFLKTSRMIAPLTVFWLVAIGTLSGFAAIAPRAAASITVSSPGIADIWFTGNTYTIMWTNTGTIANVKISYDCLICSTDGVIVASTPNTGSYSWNLPSSLRTDQYYTVRVTDVSDLNMYEDSIPFLVRAGTNMTPLIIGVVVGIVILVIVIAVVAIMMSKRKKAAKGPQQANVPMAPPPTNWQQPQQYWQQTQAPAPMPLNSAQPQYQAPATRFCRNCGKAIPTESVFCPFCGGRN